jgi:hypothetical protein
MKKSRFQRTYYHKRALKRWMLHLGGCERGGVDDELIRRLYESCGCF